MTDQFMLERFIDEAFADGPQRAPQATVDRAIRGARLERQRRAVLVALDPAAWPPRRHSIADPEFRHTLRLVLVAALIALMVTALIVVGSELFRRPVRITNVQNGSIAFQVEDLPARPYSHVRVVQPDGSGDRELLQGACPRYSRDGTRMTFVSGFAETARRFISASDGSNPTLDGFQARENYGSDAYPRWSGPLDAPSPDFSLTAYPTGKPTEKQEVWVQRISGGSAVRVATAPEDPDTHFGSIVWSPDGKWLAIATMRSIADQAEYRTSFILAAADGSGTRVLTRRIGNDSAYIDWAPDSSAVIFDGLPDGAPTPTILDGVDPLLSVYPHQDIFFINVDGTGESNLTSTPDVSEFGATWSPDGTHIQFSGYPALPGEDSSRIATLRIDAGRPVGGPHIGPANNGATWSPDGTRLLLIRDRHVSSDPQTYDSSLSIVDPEFATEPVVIWRGTVGITCAVWQPLWN